MSERQQYEPQDSTPDEQSPKMDYEPDTEEILRRQGPEFEPPKENISEIPGPSQTATDDPTKSPTVPTKQPDQQEQTAARDQKIEELRQEDEAYKEKRLAELRQEIQQYKETGGQQGEDSQSQPSQDEDYYQGYGY